LLHSKQISLFKGISPDNPQSVSIEWVLACIRQGDVNNLKDQVSRIRKLEDKKAQDKLKIKLPAVTWSGTFTYRKESGLQEYSQLICLDIDNLDKNTLDALREDLSTNKYIFAFFISPRGNGLKVLISIDSNKGDHIEHFQALEKYFFVKYAVTVDPSGKDYTRLCFLSYDPDLFVYPDAITVTIPLLNYYISAIEEKNAAELQPEPAPEPPPSRPRPALKQGAALSDLDRAEYAVREILTRGLDLTQQYQDWLEIGFSFATFGEAGRQLYHDISSVHEKYSQAETDKKFNDALKNSKFRTPAKFFALCKEFNIATRPAKELDEKGKVKPRAKKEEAPPAPTKEITYHSFHYNVKNLKTGQEEIAIDQLGLTEFLNEKGYWLMPVNDEQSYQFINIQEKIVNTTNELVMKKQALAFLDSDELRPVKRKLLSGSKQYFSRSTLENLPFIKGLEFQRDTKEEAYLYYENSYVKITGDAVTIHKYNELQAHIWKTQNIKRELKYQGPDNTGDFSRFIACIATGYKPEKVPESDTELASKKYLSVCSAIGYMLHGFKNPTESKAVVAVDAQVSFNKEANGRTGKSLINKAIQKMINVVTVDARNFNFDKPHNFANINFDTRVINFNDTSPKFDFERLFGILTEGIYINPKNRDEFFIPHEDSPKIYISTNFTLKGDGDSHRGRQFVFEVAPYFSSTYEPVMEFGKIFFTEWEEKDWQEFDSFMINCLKLYLSEGLISFPLSNYELRKLMDRVPEEALEYFDSLEIDTRYEKKEMFDAFRAQQVDFVAMKMNTFSSWLKAWVTYKKYIINPHKVKSNYRDKSGTSEFITIKIKD
jgi:hypothetical protein